MKSLISSNERSRRLASDPDASSFRHETYPRRLNHLLELSLSSPRRYLEIGVERGHTIEAVVAEQRVAVDPDPQFNLTELPPETVVFRTTSDLWFDAYHGPQFDVILVDGLHEAGQAYRDIVHSLGVLAHGGRILVDDVWPTDEPSALPSRADSAALKKRAKIGHRRWYGDVYKAVCAVTELHKEIGVQVIGTDGEHAQAVLWPRREGDWLKSRAEAMQYMADLKYREVFGAHPALPFATAISENDFLSSGPEFFDFE